MLRSAKASCTISRRRCLQRGCPCSAPAAANVHAHPAAHSGADQLRGLTCMQVRGLQIWSSLQTVRPPSDSPQPGAETTSVWNTRTRPYFTTAGNAPPSVSNSWTCSRCAWIHHHSCVLRAAIPAASPRPWPHRRHSCPTACRLGVHNKRVHLTSKHTACRLRALDQLHSSAANHAVSNNGDSHCTKPATSATSKHMFMPHQPAATKGGYCWYMHVAS